MLNYRLVAFHSDIAIVWLRQNWWQGWSSTLLIEYLHVSLIFERTTYSLLFQRSLYLGTHWWLVSSSHHWGCLRKLWSLMEQWQVRDELLFWTSLRWPSFNPWSFHSSRDTILIDIGFFDPIEASQIFNTRLRITTTGWAIHDIVIKIQILGDHIWLGW